MRSQFNIIGPDEIYLSPDNFDTEAGAAAFLDEWVKRYKEQGYYSSPDGRISLDILKDCCEIVEVYA